MDVGGSRPQPSGWFDRILTKPFGHAEITMLLAEFFSRNYD
jgi:hypothetical protein